jgi:glycolate oxidase FAD binding subunit
MRYSEKPVTLLQPASAEELAAALAESAGSRRKIETGGAFSKRAMGGPAGDEGVRLSTARMTRIVQYEPRDLTISVEPGIRWRDLAAQLAAHRQTVPLDPPFYEEATVGGVIAVNNSGPRRRLYGTARDHVIGMQFATLTGRLVDSGGMVVKNVAGLDMAKLMIGSFGTLAVITRVNFKLTPLPQNAETFVVASDTLEAAIKRRNAILGGVLQPSALDLLNPAAAELAGFNGWCLLLEAIGSRAVLDRYRKELGATLATSDLWARIREFTPRFLQQCQDGVVVRYSTTLQSMKDVLGKLDAPAITRAGSGVIYGYFQNVEEYRTCALQGTVEFAPAAAKQGLELWPDPGSSFPLMKRIKHMFDPDNLLNEGRLYGRI